MLSQHSKQYTLWCVLNINMPAYIVVTHTITSTCTVYTSRLGIHVPFSVCIFTFYHWLVCMYMNGHRHLLTAVLYAGLEDGLRHRINIEIENFRASVQEIMREQFSSHNIDPYSYEQHQQYNHHSSSSSQHHNYTPKVLV